MSKFSGLFEEAKKDNLATGSSSSPAPEPAVKKASRKTEVKPAEIKAPVRSKGRRSDPSYTGAFAYIPAQLHEDVRRELFGRKDTDFSGLVEQLLAGWLAKQKRHE